MGRLIRVGKSVLNYALKRDNNKPRALFLHIQKTAGSSIVELAKDHYLWSAISHGGYGGHKPEKFQNVAFVSGHFGYNYAKHLMDGRYSFTFLRNPLERILSFYYYNRTREIDEFPMTRLAHELNLEQFLKAGLEDPLVRARIWNNQTWQLAYGYGGKEGRGLNSFQPDELFDLAVTHLNDFSHIGFTETYEDDLKVILPNIGIPVSNKVLHVNKTKKRPVLSSLPKSTMDILEELTELDQKLYERAKLIKV